MYDGRTATMEEQTSAMVPTGKIDVSIIVVSYNTRDITLEAIRTALKGAGRYKVQLIAIDNASSDDSADAIEAAFPDIKFIRLKENVGFARANNIAAKHATGEYILLLNPDTIVFEGAIARLIDFAKQNPAAQIWGGRTIYPDGSLNAASCWRFTSPWTLAAQVIGLSKAFPNSPFLNAEAYGGWNRDSVKQVDIIVGCFMLITRALWEKLEGFDNRFFMYAEEADLCFRAHHLGARPMSTPDATIIHYGAASETVRAGKIQRLYTGKATFIRKNWGGWKAILGIGLMKLHVLIRVLGYGLAGRLTRKPRYSDAAHEWLSVWRGRRDWSRGYPA